MFFIPSNSLESSYRLTHFNLSNLPAGIGDDPQTSHPIGSLDGYGNLLPGPTYSDRLKSGALSLTRVHPNTFKLRFLRTQVEKGRAADVKTDGNDVSV